MGTHESHFLRSAGAVCLLAAITLFPATHVALAKARPVWHSRVCGMVISAAEQALAIPRQLLAAVAQVESGRWLPEHKANAAWPWTVRAEGMGHYYETKAQAIAAVRRLHARGVRSVDVGCLQINLQYHPHAFHDLEAAFDPMENVIYAATLLKGLRETARTWTDAVALYHSSDPSARAHYLAKVSRFWREEYRHHHEIAREAPRKNLLAMAPPGEINPDE